MLLSLMLKNKFIEIKNIDTTVYLFYIMDYNTSLVTTYQDNMADETSDTQYRKELLEAFNLEEFDLDIINQRIETLYTSIEKTESFQSKMREMAGMFLSEDDVMGFMICFSYHSFYIIHRIIVKYLEENVLDETLLDDIMKR